MATPEYDPSVAYQHAQHLFNAWDGDLPTLYAWLRSQNIDANVTPHAEIRRLFDAHNANLVEADVPAQYPEPAAHLVGGV